MPQYEFNNRETGESVGELFLSLEGLEDFLAMNPNLCVAPGKLRYLAGKSDDSFPSYPDMNTHTRAVEDRAPDAAPAEPASWNDSDENSGKTGYKVTDKRKNKDYSHFDEDIKKYGKIVSAPKMLGEGSATDFKYDKIDVSHPTSDAEEEQQYEMMQKDKDARRKAYEHERGMRGSSSKNAINLSDQPEGHLNPWEKGYVEQNKEHYKDLK